MPDEAATRDGQVGEALLRSAAEAAIRFRQGVPDRLHRPELTYGEMLDLLDGPTPEKGEPALQVVETLARNADRGLMMPTGARFFGWVIGSSHPVGVAADWLTSAWGQNAGNHQASPAASAAETAAAGWLLDILDLPRESSVGFVTGATVANFVCLAAARTAVLAREGWDVERQGLFGAPKVTVLIGDDAHATVFSALQLLGFGHDPVIRVATDEAGRIDADAFDAALSGAEGPVIAIAQAGQLNTGAFDPFQRLVEAIRRRGGWLHVDGAFGLWARASKDYASLAAGVDGADSWATDGHKWLQTPYDSGYAIVKDADAHRKAMTIAASYLPASTADERDPTHLVPELSRRARGFPTWAILRHLGRDGIAAMVERHCRIAAQMAERLSAEPGVEIVNQVGLNQAIVRFGADRPRAEGDALTQAVMDRVQQDGVCFVGGARWRDRWVMRISVIGWSTTEQDGARSVDAILAAWRDVC